MQTKDYIEINSPNMKILTEQALRDILGESFLVSSLTSFF